MIGDTNIPVRACEYGKNSDDKDIMGGRKPPNGIKHQDNTAEKKIPVNVPSIRTYADELNNKNEDRKVKSVSFN